MKSIHYLLLAIVYFVLSLIIPTVIGANEMRIHFVCLLFVFIFWGIGLSKSK